jgi:hypothetical protein
MKQQTYTTMVDLEEFKRMNWTLLANIKTLREYRGIMYIFREAGIPLYFAELGSLRKNNLFFGIFIHPKRDKNYGVNVYVPTKKLDKSRKLISDQERLNDAALKEEIDGEVYHQKFSDDVVANKTKALRKEQETKEQRKAARAAGERIPLAFPRKLKASGRIIPSKEERAAFQGYKADDTERYRKRLRLIIFAAVAITIISVVLMLLRNSIG